MSDLVVVEVSRRGRLVVGEPYFTPGRADPARQEGARRRRRGGPRGRLATAGARLERALGPPTGSRPCSRRCSSTRACAASSSPSTCRSRRSRGASTCATCSRSRSTPRPRRTSTTRSRRGGRATASASGCTSPTSRGSCPPGRRSTAAPPSARCRSTFPGSSRRCCRTSSPTTRARCGRTSTALCVTVEVPFDGSLEPGEPTFYRSVIRSNARSPTARPSAILAGARARDRGRRGAPARRAVALQLRRRRFARGALRIAGAEIAFAFDGEGGVERAWLETEPHAHALIEELMILANEAVAGCSPGGGAAPLPRARAARSAVGRRGCSRSSPISRSRRRPRPTRTMSPREAARVAGEASERVTRVRRAAKRGREAFPRSCCARSSRRATTRRTSATRAREPRVLPLHVADPPLSRPRRAPRAPPRARPGRRPDPRGPRRGSPSTPRSRSARRRRSSTARTTSASRGCSRTCCSSAAGRRRSRARSPA